MKLFILCMCISSVIACESKKTDSKMDNEYKLNNVSDSSILTKLTSINHKSYINRTVGEYLESKQILAFTEIIFVDEPPGKVSSILLKYDKDIFLEIFLSDAFEYSDSIQRTSEDLRNFYDKKISSVLLLSGNKVVLKI